MNLDLIDIVLHIAVLILCLVVFAALYSRHVKHGSVKESLFGSLLLVLGFLSRWGTLAILLLLCFIVYSLLWG